MQFKIQVSNPIRQNHIEDYAEDLSEAIESIFPLFTEDALILWNWVPTRVSYKYDLSVMIFDILELLDELLTHKQGSHRTFFASSSFRVEWLSKWTEETISISSHWDCVVGNYEDLLNSRSLLEISKTEFLAEWKALLKKVIETIDQTSIQIEEKQELEDLRRIEAAIPSFGILYSNQEEKEYAYN